MWKLSHYHVKKPAKYVSLDIYSYKARSIYKIANKYVFQISSLVPSAFTEQFSLLFH